MIEKDKKMVIVNIIKCFDQINIDYYENGNRIELDKDWMITACIGNDNVTTMTLIVGNDGYMIEPTKCDRWKVKTPEI